MSITVVGVNHRTAPLAVRERFAHAPHEVSASSARVLSVGAQGGVLLSTCNRTEFYLSAAQDAAPAAVSALLADRLGTGQPAAGYTYTHRDRAAVRHLYRVSAGLDSMILGESQIQGQGRDAWELARAHAGAGAAPPFQTGRARGAAGRRGSGLGGAAAP